MPSFRHSTKAQLVAALRERYREASGVSALRIAKWARDNMTNAQINAAFGAGAAAKVTSAAARYDTLQAERGE